jgi:hypothetical protein
MTTKEKIQNSSSQDCLAKTKHRFEQNDKCTNLQKTIKTDGYKRR